MSATTARRILLASVTPLALTTFAAALVGLHTLSLVTSLAALTAALVAWNLR